MLGGGGGSEEVSRSDMRRERGIQGFVGRESKVTCGALGGGGGGGSEEVS